MHSLSNKNSIKEHDFIIFELLIMEMCNMNCSYCYMRNDSPTWGKFSTKQEVYNTIVQLEKIDKKISICLSGGESTLHPNFLEFVEYISKIDNFELHINTNLQLSLSKLSKLLEYDIKLHISYHSEAENDIDFYQKLLSIPQHKQELNIMVDPRRSEEDNIDNIVKFCQDNDILFNMKPIFINDNFRPSPYVLSKMEQENQNKEYVDDKGKLYSDYDLWSNDLIPMDTYGWDCYYIFYTIDCKTGNIKQMCKLFDDLNIFDNLKFFQDYDLSKPQQCPFKSKCLWASSIDHYKVKKEL